MSRRMQGMFDLGDAPAQMSLGEDPDIDLRDLLTVAYVERSDLACERCGRTVYWCDCR